MVTFARTAHLPAAALVLLWLAAALAGASLGLLLVAVRPRLGRSRSMLADHHALLTAQDLAGWQDDRLRLLSGLAVAKHRLMRYTVDLLLAGLAVLAAAVALIAAATHGMI